MTEPRWHSDADRYCHAAGAGFICHTLAFMMAAGFIADTSSLPLIVSNLVNIVTADFFTLEFSEYASVMVPVNIASIAATLVMLHLFFRRHPGHYDLAKLKAPREAIRDARTFKAGWVVLVLLLVGFFSGAARRAGQPGGGGGGVYSLAGCPQGHVIDAGRVLGAPWQIVIFRWACIWWYTDCVTPD
jgi:arsenical pump membrane protein